MLLETPFHSRTAPLNKSARWRNWSGYMSAISYEPTHEYEYYAVRSGAALFDVSPLWKYEVTGPDAMRLVDRVVTRDVAAAAVGRVLYTPWCDEAGKIIDDGTVQHMDEGRLRITSADPNLRWFQDCAVGMNVVVSDVTEKVAALAVQGPTSRDLLSSVSHGADLKGLDFFHVTQAQVGQMPVTISRTGYTGDLGYEIWMDRDEAEGVWDALVEAGSGYGLAPAGLDALDIARIEAGLLLKEVDYISTRTALIESRKSSPYEAGLGWTVELGGEDFVGKVPLSIEAESPPEWALVGLEVEWTDIEALFRAVQLPPLVAGTASRQPAPLYSGPRQVGYATSSTFSPILKRFIALATIRREHSAPGTPLDFEVTVEFVRHRAKARVVETPFFDPRRKRS